MTPPPLLQAPFTLAEGLTREFLLHHRLCPREWGPEGAVVVALAPDARREALDDVAFAYRRRVISEEAAGSPV